MPVEPVKDPDGAHPIATRWRSTLREVVKALVEGDYSLSRGIGCVEPVDAATAQQIRDYIADYGERLAELPEETWETSVALWMRTYWDVFVDLWTHESGQSDMVLSTRVFETEDGFRVEVCSVHVP